MNKFLLTTAALALAPALLQAAPTVYSLVTELDQLKDGATVIFAYPSKGKVAGELYSSGKYILAEDLEGLTSDTKQFENTGNAVIHTIVKGEGENQFAFALTDSDGTQTYLHSTATTSLSYTSDPQYATLSVSESDGSVHVEMGDDLFFQYNYTSPRFTTYAAKSNQKDFYLFVGAPLREAARLSFTQDSLELTDADITDEFDILNYFECLEIDLSEITFSSENHHVVGIDANTNLPYFEGDSYGETFLTATFPGNETYAPAIVSMKVIYHDPRIQPVFYFETDHIDADLNDIYDIPTLNHSDFISDDEIRWVCSNDNLLTIEDGCILTNDNGVMGIATVTAYYDGDGTHASASAYFTVKVGEVESTIEYQLLTDTDQLKDGSKVIIAYRDKGYVAGSMGSNTYLPNITQNGLSQTSVSIATPADEAHIFTLLKNEEGKYALQMENGQYVTSTTAKKLASSDTPQYVSISVSGANTVIDFGTAGKLQYNASAPRFCAYATSQTAIQLFVETELFGKEELNIGKVSVRTLDEETGKYVNSAVSPVKTPTGANILVHLEGLPDGYAIDNAQVTFTDVNNDANIHVPDTPLAFHEEGYFEIDYPYGMPVGSYLMSISLPETEFYLGHEGTIDVNVDVHIDRPTLEDLFMIEGDLLLKGTHTHLLTTNADHHLFRLPNAPLEGMTIHYMVTPSASYSARRVADSPAGHEVYDHETGIEIPRTSPNGSISLVAEQNGVQAPAVTLAYEGLSMPLESGVYLVGSFCGNVLNEDAVRLTQESDGIYIGYLKLDPTPTEPVSVRFVGYDAETKAQTTYGPLGDSNVTVTESGFTNDCRWDGNCDINTHSWLITPDVFEAYGDHGVKVGINTLAAGVGFGGEFTTSIGSIDADTDAEPVYFTLQGQRVLNPSNGVFIRVTGSKAAKVRL